MTTMVVGWPSSTFPTSWPTAAGTDRVSTGTSRRSHAAWMSTSHDAPVSSPSSSLPCSARSGSPRSIVVLVRVLDTLRALRGEVASLRAETRPLLDELRVVDRRGARGGERGAHRSRSVRSRARVGGGDQRGDVGIGSGGPDGVLARRSSRRPASPPARRASCAVCGDSSGAELVQVHRATTREACER